MVDRRQNPNLPTPDGRRKTDSLYDLLEPGQGYVTVTVFAAFVGVHRKQVEKWLKADNVLPAIKLPSGDWRIPVAAAVAFLEQLRFEPTP